MKVNKVTKTSQVSSKKINKISSNTSFSEVLDYNQEERKRENLNYLLDEIKKKGKDLKHSKEVEVLVEYKKMIKAFVSEAVEYGFEINEKRGFGMRGRNKILRTVSLVDDKLLELTEALLTEEKSSIKLLAKIGEIEGLLLNLYA